MRRLVSGLRAQLTNVLVLGTIGGLAYWGHKTHWQFGHHPAPTPPEIHGTLPAAPAVGEPTAPPLDGAPQPNVDDQHESVKFDSPRSIAKSGIQTEPVAQQPIEQYIAANAVASYDQTRLAQLSTRVPGTVWRVEKRVGQPIHQGDVLAIVEAVEVGKAKAAFLDAVALVDFQRQTLERLKTLQANVISGRQVLEAEAELRRAEVGLFNAQQTLVNLGLPIHLSDIAGLPTGELFQKMRFLGLPEALVATLDPETTTANLIPLFAPFDGVVIGRDVVVGEAASPSQPQFVIADVQQMWIRLDVSQEFAGLIRVGQQVTFQAEGVPQPIACAVSWISTEVDPKTRTIEVRCDVENVRLVDAEPGDSLVGSLLLRANTFGQGKVCVRTAPAALVAPNQAVQWDGQRHLVFVQTDERTFQARQVQLGTVGERTTEIRTGLAGGETIATYGSHLLKSELMRLRLAAQ